VHIELSTIHAKKGLDGIAGDRQRRVLVLLLLVASAFAQPTMKKADCRLLIAADEGTQSVHITVQQGKVFSFHGRTLTNVFVKPIGGGWIDSLTFCGNQSDQFADLGAQAVVTLTFSRRMHQRDCYDLVSVK
jgi:hypothetical protein